MDEAKKVQETVEAEETKDTAGSCGSAEDTKAAETKSPETAETKDAESCGAEQKDSAGQEEATAGDAAAAEESGNAEAADSKEEGSDAEAAQEGASEEAQEETHKAKPDKKDQQIEELTDKYRRLFAEFDNFRKRTEVEKAGMFAEGERTVLLKVLPLIDNFERALQNVPEEEKGSAFAEGVSKIYRSFTDQLKELGVTPIEAVGTPFDANLHNAVMHVEDDEIEESTVVEEFQKGYMFRDKVLRYSMVKVAN